MNPYNAKAPMLSSAKSTEFGCLRKLKTISFYRKIPLSICLLLFTFSESNASEDVFFDSESNTLTIPTVNVDSQNSYYLELDLIQTKADLVFNIGEARQVEWSSVSDAHFSSATGGLSIANLNLGGDQWVMNLSMAQNSLQFRVDIMLMPLIDIFGNLVGVESIDSSMNRYTYRFDGAGTIKVIESEWAEFNFLINDRVEIWSTNSRTHIGNLDIAIVESPTAWRKYIERFGNYYNSETTSDLTYKGNAFAYSWDHQSMINAISIRSWIYACASEAVSTDSWTSTISACE